MSSAGGTPFRHRSLASADFEDALEFDANNLSRFLGSANGLVAMLDARSSRYGEDDDDDDDGRDSDTSDGSTLGNASVGLETCSLNLSTSSSAPQTPTALGPDIQVTDSAAAPAAAASAPPAAPGKATGSARAATGTGAATGSAEQGAGTGAGAGAGTGTGPGAAFATAAADGEAAAAQVEDPLAEYKNNPDWLELDDARTGKVMYYNIVTRKTVRP